MEEQHGTAMDTTSMSLLSTAPSTTTSSKRKKKTKTERRKMFEDILPAIKTKVRELEAKHHELNNPEDVLIIVDISFVSLIPILHRFGFKTFDQRQCENGAFFKKQDAILTLAGYFKKCLDNPPLPHCYLLTTLQNKERFEVHSGVEDVSKIIACPILGFSCAKTALCSVIEATKAKVDVTNLTEHCPKCGSADACIDVPAEVFKLVYLQFAKQKGFLQKLKIENLSIEELLANLHKANMIKMEDNWMIYEFDESSALKFHMGDQVLCEFHLDVGSDVVNEKKKYKCDTKIFDNLKTKSHDVSFCVKCFEFF